MVGRFHFHWEVAINVSSLAAVPTLNSLPLSLTCPHHTSHWANPSLAGLKLAYLRLSLAATGLFNLWRRVRQRLAIDWGGVCHARNQSVLNVI